MFQDAPARKTTYCWLFERCSLFMMHFGLRRVLRYCKIYLYHNWNYWLSCSDSRKWCHYFVLTMRGIYAFFCIVYFLIVLCLIIMNISVHRYVLFYWTHVVYDTDLFRQTQLCLYLWYILTLTRRYIPRRGNPDLYIFLNILEGFTRIRRIRDQQRYEFG